MFFRALKEFRIRPVSQYLLIKYAQVFVTATTVIEIKQKKVLIKAEITTMPDIF
jgi:hypothetical protein